MDLGYTLCASIMLPTIHLYRLDWLLYGGAMCSSGHWLGQEGFADHFGGSTGREASRPRRQGYTCHTSPMLCHRLQPAYKRGSVKTEK